MTIADRLDYLTPAACPVCGNEDRVYLRLDNELVCRSHFPRVGLNPDRELLRTSRDQGPTRRES